MANSKEIFWSAKELLTGGIAKVCHWPISAFDAKGSRVGVDDPSAKHFTASGAIMKSLMDHFGNNDLDKKTTVYLEELAKFIPEAYIHKYDLPISLDLACLNKTDEEIIYAFENVIRGIQEKTGQS